VLIRTKACLQPCRKDMLHGLQARFYRKRGLLPLEDHPDD
jgi:hypothetical protein